MSPIQDLDRALAADSRVGGKARNLARLRAAGLPCPPGFVISAPATGDSSWRAQALEAAGLLQSPLAVRSSASIEDSSGGAAPGLFESLLDIDLATLTEAVERVLASASSDSVRSYCRLRDIDPECVSMSVVVQEQIAPMKAAGVLYTRPPSQPNAARLIIDIEHGPDGPWTGVRPRDGSGPSVPLPQGTWAALARAALAAEAAIDAPQGADVEWVIDSANQVWLVQARPIIHAAAAHSPSPDLFDFSVGDAREWSWDVTHNPDPLSPAQAGLVSLVGTTGVGGEMRVVGGYLYTAPPRWPAVPAAVADSPGSLTRFFTDEIVPVVDAELRALESGEAPSLERALAAYERVVTLYGRTVAPTLRAGREPLRRLIESHAPDANISRLMTALLATRSDRHLATRIRRVAAGRGGIDSLLAYAAPMAPAWDVAAPTFAEDPSPILGSVETERARSKGQRPDDTREADVQAIRLRTAIGLDRQNEFDRALARAREAHELGETDDHVFFRAQAVVRRALLEVAARWELEDPNDIFYVDLDWVANQDVSQAPLGLAQRVATARERRDHQRATQMPLTFANGRARANRSRGAFGVGWRGIGCGGRSRGNVLKLSDLGAIHAPAEGRVILAKALSPSLLFKVSGAAALVSVYGGPLGHGAAMARELGLPCVVQCHGAWEALADGDDVWVDGEAGLVVPARAAASAGQRP